MYEVLVILAQVLVWFLCQSITFVLVLKHIKMSFPSLELSLGDFIAAFLISLLWIIILPLCIIAFPFYFLYKKVKEN